MKSCRASHQADQVDFKHLAKSAHLEFAAPVDHRALRQHQHVEPVEGRLEILDRLGIADVELRVVEALEMRSLVRRIIGGGRAGAANMHARAPGAERLRDAVADAAGAGDHQDLLAAEIQFVHGTLDPLFSRGLTSLRIGASLVNLAVYDIFGEWTAA